MILSAVKICYDSSHQPFASEGAVKIQNLNSERSALKIIRAVLRESDINPDDAVNHSIHRCYCRFKIKVEEDDEDETFNPESTLDELEIKEGDSVFIREIEDRVEEMEEDQGSAPRRSSRKRKETDYNEEDHYNGSLESNVPSTPTSRKTGSTSNPRTGPAAVDKVSSNLENLTFQASVAAKSISKLLGGDGWKSQSIGKLGLIQSRGHSQLQGLSRLVKTSLEIPQPSNSERSGFFSSDLVEALTRAYHQRVGSWMAKQGQNNFFDLLPSEYEQANELLKGKIEGNGSWERSNLNHLDESAFSKPADRFPLSDSGLSGQYLSTARAIAVLWNNKKWIDQAPLPGLSPISLKHDQRNAVLHQIAELTRVKPGEATPDGYPPSVLQAIRESIKKNEKAFKSNRGGSQAGWAQTRCIKDAFALLKKRVNLSVRSPSSSTVTGSSKAARNDEDEIKGSRAKRRKIAS